MNKLLINIALFNLGWLACVVGGNAWALWVVPAALLLHYLLVSRHSVEWLLIVLCAVVGTLVDALWQWTGVLLFIPDSSFVPLWLIALWLLFSTTLDHALGFLQQRLWLAAAVGAVAGPLTYLAGVKLGAATAGVAMLQLFLLMALCWALLLPALLYIVREGKNRWPVSNFA